MPRRAGGLTSRPCADGSSQVLAARAAGCRSGQRRHIPLATCCGGVGVAIPRYAQTDPRCSLAPLGVSTRGRHSGRQLVRRVGRDATPHSSGTSCRAVWGSSRRTVIPRADRRARSGPAGGLRRAAPLRQAGCVDGPTRVVAAGLHAPDLGQRKPARPARLAVGSIGHGGRGRARARTGQRAVGHTISESAHRPARPPTHRRWGSCRWERHWVNSLERAGRGTRRAGGPRPHRRPTAGPTTRTSSTTGSRRSSWQAPGTNLRALFCVTPHSSPFNRARKSPHKV